MPELFLRLYGIPNCPHCETAVRYLIAANLPPNVLQVVPLVGDPILEAGIKAITGREDVTVPALVSFVTNPGEVIIGWRESDYARIVQLVRAGVGPSAPDVSSAQGGATETYTGAPSTPGAANSVPVAVSGVPGSVVSPGGANPTQPG